ncbi:MAG: ABC transporter permease [Hyphomonadaceae bacterium]|nr:ABC transporter permease [Hyphomonadaceae bacterium]
MIAKPGRRDGLFADPLFIAGAALAALAALSAAFGHWLTPFSPDEVTDIVSEPPPPIADWPNLFVAALGGEGVHWFGTDAAGFDVFARTLAAARTDLLIAVAAAAISAAIGAPLGVIAGAVRTPATEALARASDVLQSFPVFITAMVLVALAGRSWASIVLAMTLLYAPIFLRLTRAEALAVSARGYVEAARIAGVPGWRIALQHVAPNALGPALSQLSVTIGFAILLTAGLSFVGAGVRPPTPEWGLMIAQGAGQIVLGDWWPALFPGAAITLTVFGFAAMGQSLEARYGR